MWVQLSSDFLNLDHVTRIRFSTVWKNEQQYLVAEIDVREDGEIKPYTRYRGADAEVLRAAVGAAVVPAPLSRPVNPPVANGIVPVATASSLPTLSDL
jgi:hypothetical protein